MCGICGIVDLDGPPITAATVEAMISTLRHRGPDHTATHLSPAAGLGHARLSIIDLSTSANQPMVSGDGSLVAVYNGEIYNFLELRDELTARGVVFRTHSDTEVALAAFQAWQERAFARFNGMFAIAIWDLRQRRLHLARDRFGIKPLYLTRGDRWIAFGSEIKALLASGRVSRRVCRQALHEYLYYGAALGDRSMLDDVRELPPAHHATFDARGFSQEAYASIHAPIRPRADTPEVAAEVRRLLDRSVKRHLISDVPVGVFLSGGIDSSSVTALASGHYPGRLKTYSVAFDFQKGEGELPAARMVAARFGTEHHEIRVTTHDLANVIEKLVACHDEPFGDAANIPLYLLAERLRGSVKVVLQGDGGDELFGGYRRHALLSWGPLLPTLARLPGSSLARHLPIPGSERVARLWDAFRETDPILRMALLLTDETLAAPPTRLLTPAALRLLDGTDPFARYREVGAALAHLDPAQQMISTDCSIILPDIYLEKVDRATMAHGLEVRVPMLDHELAEYVMALPSQFKVRRGQTKRVLRRAMRGTLPDAILDAPKQGFGVPYSQWLRGPLGPYLESVLLDDSVGRAGFFAPGPLARAVTEHLRGRRDHGFLLWKALNLQIWITRFGIDPLAT